MFSRRGIIASGAVVIVAVAAGVIGLARGGAAGGDRSAYTTNLTHQTVVPGAVSASEVISGIVKRSGASHILSTKIIPAPSIQGVRPGLWLNYLVQQKSGESVLRPEWEADLTVGAISDALEAAHLGTVAGVHVDVQKPDGTIAYNASGGMGDILPGQSFDAGSDTAIIASITSGLNAAGLTPDTISVLHADQPAPVVVATTADPQAAAKAAAQTIQTIFGQNPPKYEGYYFEVRDARGAVVLIQTEAFRTGASAQWVNPSVAAVSSLQRL
jgi:hypothetical protein